MKMMKMKKWLAVGRPRKPSSNNRLAIFAQSRKEALKEARHHFVNPRIVRRLSILR